MPEVQEIEAPPVTLVWSDWRPLRQKNRGGPPGAPEKPGVYEIRCRLRADDGEPEVAYIGRSARGVKGLKGRIDNHRSKPGDCADNLVNKQRFWDKTLEPIEVRWSVTQDSHYAEALLLRVFRDRHGRLPQFNTEG